MDAERFNRVWERSWQVDTHLNIEQLTISALIEEINQMEDEIAELKKNLEIEEAWNARYRDIITNGDNDAIMLHKDGITTKTELPKLDANITLEKIRRGKHARVELSR